MPRSSFAPRTIGGLNNFEDRTTTYAPFVRTLTQRIARHAPQARFIAGTTSLSIVWLVVCILFAVVIVFLILSLFEGLPPVGPWVIAIAVGVAAPLIARQIRQGPANTFDPAAPPPELLGEG